MESSTFEMDKKIVIVGAGPCGLGAGWRLKELGHCDYVILESYSTAGGLASTETDESLFLWDISGHVIFFHYEYFDNLLDVVNEDWCYHKLEGFCMDERSIHSLPFTEQPSSSSRGRVTKMFGQSC